MNKLTRITLHTLGLATVAVPSFCAKDAGAEPRPDREGLRALAARAAVRAHVARRLNLTAEQITRLKSRRSVAADAMKAIRADEGLTREQKIAQGRSLGEATRGEMRAILTPEQRAKLDAFRERLGERQRTQRSAAGTP